MSGGEGRTTQLILQEFTIEINNFDADSRELIYNGHSELLMT